MHYWIDTGNKQHGPFNAAQLKKLAFKGELKRSHKISTDQERWVVAESVKGLEFKTEETAEPDLANLFDEEVGDDYQVAPALPRPTSRAAAATNESDRLARSATSQECPKCNASLRVIRKNDSLTGKMLCAACEISPGSCPVCGKSLATKAAQQCLNCGSSWHSDSLRKRAAEQPADATEPQTHTRRNGEPAECSDCQRSRPHDEIYSCPKCRNLVCSDCLRNKQPSLWAGLSGDCPACGALCESGHLLMVKERSTPPTERHELAKPDRESSSQSPPMASTPDPKDASSETAELGKKDVHPLLCMLVSGVILAAIGVVWSFIYPQHPAESAMTEPSIIPRPLGVVVLPFMFVALYGAFEILSYHVPIFAVGQMFFGGTVQLFVWLGGAVMLIFGRWPRTNFFDMFDAWKAATRESSAEDANKVVKRDSDSDSTFAVQVSVVVAIVGWCLFGPLAVWSSFQEAATQQVVELPDWRGSEWSRHVDSKGRFTCDIPPGWDVDESQQGPKSKVTFSYGQHRIAVTVRDTEYHEMYSGIEQEMIEGMKETAVNMGPDGEVGEVEWTTLAGRRALQIDLASALNERFARTIKAKHSGWDHFIGAYIEPSSQKDELCDLFAEFLTRYEQPALIRQLRIAIANKSELDLSDLDEEQIVAGLKYIEDKHYDLESASLLLPLLRRKEPEILLPLMFFVRQEPTEAAVARSMVATHVNHADEVVRDGVRQTLATIDQADPTLRTLKEAFSVRNAYDIPLQVNGLAATARMMVVEALDPSTILAVLESNDSHADYRVLLGELTASPVVAGEMKTRWEYQFRDISPSPNRFAIDGRLSCYFKVLPTDLECASGNKVFPMLETAGSDQRFDRDTLLASLMGFNGFFTQPGNVFEASIDSEAEVPGKFRFTVSSFNREDQSLRIVATDVADDWSVAIYDGVLNSKGAALFASPIELNRVYESGDSSLTSHEMSHVTVTLTPNQTLVAYTPVGAFELARLAKRTTRPVYLESFPSRGVYWKGVLHKGDEEPTAVQLTVCEIREDSNYLRAVLWPTATPNVITVYEGSLNRIAQRESYAMTLQKILPAALSEGTKGVFGTGDGQLELRVSYSGENMYARSSDGEHLSLAHDKDAGQPRNVSTQIMSKVLPAVANNSRAKRGRQWKGTLMNRVTERSIPVSLQFVPTGDDDIFVVHAEVTSLVSGEIGNAVRFEGRIRLQDKHINEFPYALKKVSGGDASHSSTTLGPAKCELYLRLSDDGRRLTGFTTNEAFDLKSE